MKTGKCWFYSEKEKNGKYTVFEVNIFNNDIDEAERKARTINTKKGWGKMPGGFFSYKANPQHFKQNYNVIKVANNTKIQPYTKHDKLIINLIEAEKNAKYKIL